MYSDQSGYQPVDGHPHSRLGSVRAAVGAGTTVSEPSAAPLIVALARTPTGAILPGRPTGAKAALQSGRGVATLSPRESDPALVALLQSVATTQQELTTVLSDVKRYVVSGSSWQSLALGPGWASGIDVLACDGCSWVQLVA